MKKNILFTGLFLLLALALLLSACADKEKTDGIDKPQESMTSTENSQPQTPPELQEQDSEADSTEQNIVTIAHLQPGILYEDDMVKISVDGMEMVEGYPEILFTFANKTDQALRFSEDYVIVNGIVLPTQVGVIPAAHTAEPSRMIFTKYRELDKAKITHISSIEIEMTIVDHVTWEDLYTIPRMSVPMKEEEGYIQPQTEERVLADNELVRITLIDTVQLEESIMSYLLIENKADEEIRADTTQFVINGIEMSHNGFYVEVPVGYKGILQIDLAVYLLKQHYGIDSLKDFSVSISLSNESSWDIMLIDDMPVYP